MGNSVLAFENTVTVTEFPRWQRERRQSYNPGGVDEARDPASAMHCIACQHTNDADAVFCEECGSKLARACADCGAELKSTSRFCPKCGSPVGAKVPLPQPQARSAADYTPKHLAEKSLLSRAAVEGERKTVTALFADVKGSTALIEDLDPEEARAILDPALELMMDAVHRYEGYVAQVLGDGVFALFGAPIAQEDHAQRALRGNSVRKFGDSNCISGSAARSCDGHLTARR